MRRQLESILLAHDVGPHDIDRFLRSQIIPNVSPELMARFRPDQRPIGQRGATSSRNPVGAGTEKFSNRIKWARQFARAYAAEQEGERLRGIRADEIALARSQRPPDDRRFRPAKPGAGSILGTGSPFRSYGSPVGGGRALGGAGARGGSILGGALGRV